MTWDEFKAAVEADGVQDGDVVDAIDVSPGGYAPSVAFKQRVDGTRLIEISDFPARCTAAAAERIVKPLRGSQ